MPEIDTHHEKLHIAYICSSNNERNQYISQKYSYGKKSQASFSLCIQTNVEVFFFFNYIKAAKKLQRKPAKEM